MYFVYRENLLLQVLQFVTMSAAENSRGSSLNQESKTQGIYYIYTCRYFVEQ